MVSYLTSADASAYNYRRRYIGETADTLVFPMLNIGMGSWVHSRLYIFEGS